MSHRNKLSSRYSIGPQSLKGTFMYVPVRLCIYIWSCMCIWDSVYTYSHVCAFETYGISAWQLISVWHASREIYHGSTESQRHIHDHIYIYGIYDCMAIYDMWPYDIYDHESLKGTYITIDIYDIYDCMIYMTYGYMVYMTVRVSKPHIWPENLKGYSRRATQ